MSISGSDKLNSIKLDMFDSQTVVTGCTLEGIFLFQKEAVNQVSVTNSYSCLNTVNHLSIAGTIR